MLHESSSRRRALPSRRPGGRGMSCQGTKCLLPPLCLHGRLTEARRPSFTLAVAATTIHFMNEVWSVERLANHWNGYGFSWHATCYLVTPEAPEDERSPPHRSRALRYFVLLDALSQETLQAGPPRASCRKKRAPLDGTPSLPRQRSGRDPPCSTGPRSWNDATSRARCSVSSQGREHRTRRPHLEVATE